MVKIDENRNNEGIGTHDASPQQFKNQTDQNKSFERSGSSIISRLFPIVIGLSIISIIDDGILFLPEEQLMQKKMLPLGQETKYLLQHFFLRGLLDCFTFLFSSSKNQ